MIKTIRSWENHVLYVDQSGNMHYELTKIEQTTPRVLYVDIAGNVDGRLYVLAPLCIDDVLKAVEYLRKERKLLEILDD